MLLQVGVSEKQKREKKNKKTLGQPVELCESWNLKPHYEVPLYCTDSGWMSVWRNKGQEEEEKEEGMNEGKGK